MNREGVVMSNATPHDTKYCNIVVFYQNFCMRGDFDISDIAREKTDNPKFRAAHAQRFMDFLSLIYIGVKCDDVKIFQGDAIKNIHIKDSSCHMQPQEDAIKFFIDTYQGYWGGSVIDYKNPKTIFAWCALEGVIVAPVAVLEWMKQSTNSRELLRPDLLEDTTGEVLSLVSTPAVEKEHGSTDEAQEYIEAWEILLPTLGKNNERRAASLAVEKWRGASHQSAYMNSMANYPDLFEDNIIDKNRFVSKRKKIAESLATQHGLNMPEWDTR